MPYDSSKYLDKDGNLVHTRSGDIIKVWKEINKFTGEGEFISIEHKNSQSKEEKRKKDSKLETLFGGLRCLELDIAMIVARFEEPITNENLETLLINLETLKSNVDTVIAFAKKIRSKT